MMLITTSKIICALLLVNFVCSKYNNDKQTAEKPQAKISLPLTAEDTLVMPYILKKTNHGEESNRFTLLTSAQSNTFKEENSAMKHEQNIPLPKVPKSPDWERDSNYLTSPYNYIRPLMCSNNNGLANTDPGVPIAIMLFVNLGILSYLLMGIGGLFNRVLRFTPTSHHSGGYNEGHSIYYKNNDHFDY